jgi:hypothetical protein
MTCADRSGAPAGSTPAASARNHSPPRFPDGIPPIGHTGRCGRPPFVCSYRPRVCSYRPRRARARAALIGPRCRDAGIRTSLRSLLRDTRKQGANLGLPVAAVTTQSADRGQLASLRPPRDGLGVDSEHRRDLSWREQRLGLGCACGHVCGLSSWTGTSIRRLLACLRPTWGLVVDALVWPIETILPSPDVTSRPPRAKILCKLPRLLPKPIAVTIRNSSDTFGRNGARSGKCPALRGAPAACRAVRCSPRRLAPAGRPGQLAVSAACRARQRALSRWYMAAASSSSPVSRP